MRNTSYYTHGGDVYSAPVRLDFSSTLNPLGRPNTVRSALAHVEELAGAYPDPKCRELKATERARTAAACPSGTAQRVVDEVNREPFVRVCNAVADVVLGK